MTTQKQIFSRIDAEILIYLNKSHNEKNNFIYKMRKEINRTHSHITNRVNILIKKKFIIRKVEFNKRVKYLYLTKKGKKLAIKLSELNNLMK